MIRVGFFGTPDLARAVLRDIIASSNIEISFVVTNPDKPFGREQSLKSSPVKALAIDHHIPIFTPVRVRGNEQLLNDIGSFECDYFIVVAYGRILPKEVLDLPKKMCINIHGSILPKYRGASPIQAALYHGEEETGVTIMKMSEEMDEGDILKIRTIPIDTGETSETLFSKFAQISGPTLLQTLGELEHGGITSLSQDHSLATYCKKIEKEDGFINWSKSAKDIYHMWQAYTPWPGIYTHYQDKRLLLERVAYIIESHQYSVGTVLKLENGNISIACGSGFLTLEQVKLEGKKSQTIKDFVNGNQKFISSVL